MAFVLRAFTPYRHYLANGPLRVFPIDLSRKAFDAFEMRITAAAFSAFLNSSALADWYLEDFNSDMWEALIRYDEKTHSFFANNPQATVELRDMGYLQWSGQGSPVQEWRNRDVSDIYPIWLKAQDNTVLTVTIPNDKVVALRDVLKAFGAIVA